MSDVLYRNGDLVVEIDGDILTTRERGVYVQSALTPPPHDNSDFVRTVERWLLEIEQEDILPMSEPLYE